eukprot:s32_g23.t1
MRFVLLTQDRNNPSLFLLKDNRGQFISTFFSAENAQKAFYACCLQEARSPDESTTDMLSHSDKVRSSDAAVVRQQIAYCGCLGRIGSTRFVRRLVLISEKMCIPLSRCHS